MTQIIMTIAVLCQVNSAPPMYSYIGIKNMQKSCAQDIIKCMANTRKQKKDFTQDEALLYCVLEGKY